MRFIKNGISDKTKNLTPIFKDLFILEDSEVYTKEIMLNTLFYTSSCLGSVSRQDGLDIDTSWCFVIDNYNLYEDEQTGKYKLYGDLYVDLDSKKNKEIINLLIKYSSYGFKPILEINCDIFENDYYSIINERDELDIFINFNSCYIIDSKIYNKCVTESRKNKIKLLLENK